MANLTLHLRTDEGLDPANLTASIQKELESLPEVQSANLDAEHYRSIGPAEIVAGISLATVAIKSAAEAVQAITKFVAAVQELVKAGKGLHEAVVDVGMRRVPVAELTQADIEKLAAKLTAKPA
jgi:hypothetical protein